MVSRASTCARKPSSVRTCTKGAKIVLPVSKVIPQKESFPARNELSRKKLNKPDAARAVLALAQIRDLRSHAEPEGAGCDPAFLRTSSLPANVRTKAISCPIVMPPVGAHCPRTFRVLKSSQVEVPTPQIQSFNCGDWCCHMRTRPGSELFQMPCSSIHVEDPSFPPAFYTRIYRTPPHGAESSAPRSESSWFTTKVEREAHCPFLIHGS